MTSTPSQVRTTPAVGSYALDQSHSHVSFSARHLMVTKVRGRFPVTAGHLEISEDPTQSSVVATIDVSAVDSGDQKRDEHLRSADFFDAEKYPTVAFHSTNTRVGFAAETEVNRKDWGLEWNVALETGGVLVGDKVKLTIDAEWVKE